MKKYYYTLFFTLFFSLQNSFAQMTPDLEVNIPMRDGQVLAADVYIPSGCADCPTILIQTPYNKNLFRFGLPMGTLTDVDGSPFTWVVVDWRGFYGSTAATVPTPNRGEDGYDVIDWIVSQSWNNGRVGTWGPSALGKIQYLTAKEKHPNHTCAVPIVAHPHNSYDDFFYGGVLEESRLNQLDALGYGLSPTVLANPYYSTVWQFAENNSWYPEDIEIPTLQIGGWYDHNIDKMVKWYEATRNEAEMSVRDKQWFLVGPWVHGGTGSASVGSAIQGELYYPNAEFKNDTMSMKFFKFYLLDEANEWESTPLFTYYELGKNQWNSTNSASINETNINTLYLGSSQRLRSNFGIGNTYFASKAGQPTPTIGGQTLSPSLDQGPYAQNMLDFRRDVLIFRTTTFNTDVQISGRVKVILYVKSNQPDADICIRLCDEDSDGVSMLVNDGIKRLRFRNGYTAADEVFMNDTDIYEVEIELPFVNYTWKAGNRLKIYVTGNSSTRWNVNLQNGGTMYTTGDTNIANIDIYHNEMYPSRIELPGNNTYLSIDNFTENNFVIFPNPGNESFQILYNNDIKEVIIYDISGKMVLNQINNNQIFDVSYLDRGMYIVQFLDYNQQIIHTGKWIKN